MNIIQIVSYRENGFILSKDANAAFLEKKSIGIGINPKLMYRSGIDVVGCQLNIVYESEGKTIMEYKALFSVFIEGWADFIKNNPSDKEISEHVKQAWNEVIGFARAMIYVKANNEESEISKYILPSIDLDDFVNKIAIEKQN